MDTGTEFNDCNDKNNGSNDNASGNNQCNLTGCIQCREVIRTIEIKNKQLHHQIMEMEEDHEIIQREFPQGVETVLNEISQKDKKIDELEEIIKQLTIVLKQLEQSINQDTFQTEAMQQLQHENKKLQDDKKKALYELEKMKEDISRKQNATELANNELKEMKKASENEQRDELYKLLSENEILRSELREVHETLTKISEVALEYEAANNALILKETETSALLTQQTEEMDRLYSELDTMKYDQAALESRLVDVEEKNEEKHMRADDQILQRDTEITILKKEITQLHKHIENKHNSAQLEKSSDNEAGEFEKQVEMLHELRSRDKDTIKDLNERILQLQSDLESLVQHIDLDESSKQAVSTAVAVSETRALNLENENRQLVDRLMEQRELIRELESKLLEYEMELADAMSWGEILEKQSTLEDVVKYQKDLRKELQEEKLANRKLLQALDNQLDATSKIQTAFDRLKREVGKPLEFQYLDLDLEKEMKGKVAVHEALVRELESQIEGMENERQQLLSKLREQAIRHGNQLFHDKGLSQSEVKCVDEFILCLKDAPEVAHRKIIELKERNIQFTQKNDENIENWQKQVEIYLKENSRLRALLQNEFERSCLEKEDFRFNKCKCSYHERQDIHILGTENSPTCELIQIIKNEGNHESEEDRWHIETEDSRMSGEDLTQPDAIYRVSKTIGHTSNEQVHRFIHCASVSTMTHVDCKLDAMPMPLESLDRSSSTSQVLLVNQETQTLGHQAEKQHEECITKSGSSNEIAEIVSNAIEAKLKLLTQAIMQGEHPMLTKKIKTTLLGSSSIEHSDNSSCITHQMLPACEDTDLGKQTLCGGNACSDKHENEEAKNESLLAELKSQEAKFQALKEQHDATYSQLSNEQKLFETEKNKTSEEIVSLKQSIEDLQAMIHRYDASWKLLELAETEENAAAANSNYRLEIIHLTKQVVTFEVSNSQLKRKVLQLNVELGHLQQRDRDHAAEVLELERSLKFRILYLESWKSRAEDRMERMVKKLETSVYSRSESKQSAEKLELLNVCEKLREELSELHAKYLCIYLAPIELCSLRHENKVLQQVIEKNEASELQLIKNKQDGQRIIELEIALEIECEKTKRLESIVVSEKLRCAEELKKWIIYENNNPPLQLENQALYERIDELEQLYESLLIEYKKQKDMGQIAASQADILAKKLQQTLQNLSDIQQHVRNLDMKSDDQSLVGRLQAEIMQVKNSYQHFVLKYTRLLDQNQEATIKLQTLELQKEQLANELADFRESAAVNKQRLEKTIAELKESDHTFRNSQWDSFRSKLRDLESQLEKLIEEKRSIENDLEELKSQKLQLPLHSHADQSQDDDKSNQITALKCEVDLLKRRETNLLEQLTIAGAGESPKERNSLLSSELAKKDKLNADLISQMQVHQDRIQQLLQLQIDLESQLQKKTNELDEFSLYHSQVLARLKLFESMAKPEYDSPPYQINDPVPNVSEMSQKKVQMYEKDSEALQQAAQITIASLKNLVEEKNDLLGTYQRQILNLRKEYEDKIAEDRNNSQCLHQKVYEENQKMIEQLKEAAETIQSLEARESRNIIQQSGQDRLEEVLMEWKKSEIELERQKQLVQELNNHIFAINDDKNIAEARAGEALEEIISNKEIVEHLKFRIRDLEAKFTKLKIEIGRREEKRAQLREAMILLKEEFLRAEDRHAVELAKAQQVVKVEKKKVKDNKQSEISELNATNELLKAQVQMLEEKLRCKIKRHTEKHPVEICNTSNVHFQEEFSDSTTAQDRFAKEQLESEISRLQGIISDNSKNETQLVEVFEKKIKVLEAQNTALRGSAPAFSNHQCEATMQHINMREEEKKYSRRIKLLTLRLKDKQDQIHTKDIEIQQLLEKLQKIHSSYNSLELELQRKNDKGKDINRVSVLNNRSHEEVEYLQQHNDFLKQTLQVQQREWAEASRQQIEMYERQLKRMQSRLIACGSENPVSEHTDWDRDANLLQQEEQTFLVRDEMAKELEMLGNEYKTKELQAIERETRLMDCELELASAKLELKRLSRTQPVSKVKIVGKAALPTTKRAAQFSPHDSQELENLVANMKKIIDRLKHENFQLKCSTKNATSPRQMEILKREIKKLRSQDKVWSEQQEDHRKEMESLKREKLMWQQKYRNSKKNTVDHNDHQKKIAEVQKELELAHEVIRAKIAQIEELEAELSSMRTDRQEITPNQRDKDGKNRELHRQLVKIQFLEAENSRLANELADFDEEFFEEIEDLKYKYDQAKRENHILQQQLLRYGE